MRAGTAKKNLHKGLLVEPKSSWSLSDMIVKRAFWAVW